MNEDRPYVLSIAGFDPTGGAGVLTDIKTFEMHKTAGLGVCTSLTYQNDVDFLGVDWVNLEQIKMQIDILFKRFPIDWVKIGLVQNLSVLHEIIGLLKILNPQVSIIWDPIIKASAGFVFHESINEKGLEKLLNELYLITPNQEEILKLVPGAENEEAALKLSKYCNVLLKGGHRNDGLALDVLYEGENKSFFEGKMISGSKHGTGCVLSAAILSNLSNGKIIKEACMEGKKYITEFILSNNSLLGYHYV